MEKQGSAAQTPEQKTKDMVVRIDVDILFAGDETAHKSTYMLITGVPEDLPKEYENTVIKTAESQFAQALNQRLYLEFYNPGKTSADEQPMFINLSKVEAIKIKDVQKVN